MRRTSQLLSILCVLLACGGCSPSKRISGDATQIDNAALAIGDHANKATILVPPSADPQLGSHLTAIKNLSGVIHQKVGDIHAQIPQVEDKTGWFGKNLKLIAIIVAPVALLILLWQTGVLGFLRGWLGLVTPAIKTQAHLDAITGKSPSLPSPSFRGAFKRAKRRLKGK